MGVIIHIATNINSPAPFPDEPADLCKTGEYFRPTNRHYDFVTTDNEVSIPPDGGGDLSAYILNSGFYYAVGNTNNFPVNYDLITLVITTNELGNYFQVLSNLNDSLD